MSDLTLPPELLDHIVDLLHDDRRSLKNCCLVSKSWIPRARKNLFANVEFHNHMHLFSWKNTFPDPSASPAYYTQTLIINFYPVVMAADAEQGGWIPTFSRVAHFEIRTSPFEPVNYNLVPLHGFAPALKSLHVAFLGLPSSNTFNFIYSFPLLEDLRLETDMLYSGNVGENPPVTQLSSPPPFTGTLKLSLNTGTIPAISQLLSLPGGLHFRELHLTFFCQRDILSMEALVERCSSTLKILKIGSKLFVTPLPLPHFLINLSKATKLENVAFICPRSPQRVASTLRTITPNHRNLLWISFCYGNNHLDIYHDIDDFRASIGKTDYRGWLELDRLLVELWESHSVRLRVLYGGSASTTLKPRTKLCMESLFPEMTVRGMVELINYDDLGGF